MRNPTAFLRKEYEDLVEKGFDWKLRNLQGPSKPHCTIEGCNVIMLCANNYLNMSNHPKVVEAAIQATKSHGAGSGSVRAIAGSMDLHFDLEAGSRRPLASGFRQGQPILPPTRRVTAYHDFR